MGNANSGPRPKPHALKVLRGERKDRLNPNEPKPPAGEVQKHPALSDRGVVVWDRIAPVCLAMGTLTTGDVEAFKVLCELQADLDDASRAKNAPDYAIFTLSEDYNGAPKMGLHASVKTEKELAPIVRPYYAMFGLEPTGRARLKVQKEPEAPASKWAGVLA